MMHAHFGSPILCIIDDGACLFTFDRNVKERMLACSLHGQVKAVAPPPRIYMIRHASRVGESIGRAQAGARQLSCILNINMLA